ncbi:diacylglycerol kinase family protein [Pannonibacter sp. Pt2-lr]
MRVTALLNRDGGTLKTADIQAVCHLIEAEFSAAGHEVQCIVTSSARLEDNLQRIAGDPATEVILAGGGDGTISAAAAMAYHSGKVLGVLPAGTMNLFARSSPFLSSLTRPSRPGESRNRALRHRPDERQALRASVFPRPAGADDP